MPLERLRCAGGKCPAPQRLAYASEAVNDYLIAVLSRDANASAFVEHLTGPEGRDALRAAGFTVP